MLAKALQDPAALKEKAKSLDDMWKELILTPHDYNQKALFNETTRSLMEKITFEHGGPEYDKKYPDGIPTSVQITLKCKVIELHRELIKNYASWRGS